MAADCSHECNNRRSGFQQGKIFCGKAPEVVDSMPPDIDSIAKNK
jgi:hypothetical protein